MSVSTLTTQTNGHDTMKLQATLCLSLIALYCAPAAAVTETDKSVDRLGVQGGTAYFSIKDPFSTNCKFDVVYFSIGDDFGKAAYASLLAAQTSGKKLSRFDYAQSAPGETCTLSLVESRS
ncbi:hypothetical protein NG831_13380 [Xanthomonas sacchari]|uniref:hypothetical protein n=1 Tax=Xanthomonas TaxID=338 RepID=UPI001E2F565A|nr:MULTISPECIES: hypothetical protein [Xanthomonas]MCW0403606.1 hypothetical protein [Xanthomonas sacchari]MCW0412211.1 hypothetical protein [Xanthomonas sacchari]MCW0414849.1 hypothetical protein [Xanthomonas sacchari]MCW0437066.1 hypothetical protein [Xanthomonas sacchari]MDV0439047.1 hypothetical protein [Xanthomonas sacchari]